MPEKEQLIQTFVESLDMCLICEQAKLYKQNVVLKGTVSRDFRHIFIKKTQPGPHINRQKRFRKISSV